MIRHEPRATQGRTSAASDECKRQRPTHADPYRPRPTQDLSRTYPLPTPSSPRDKHEGPRTDPARPKTNHTPPDRPRTNQPDPNHPKPCFHGWRKCKSHLCCGEFRWEHTCRQAVKNMCRTWSNSQLGAEVKSKVLRKFKRGFTCR